MRKSLARLIVGLAFIVVGIVYLGNALNFWELNIFFPGWWTLFIIVPAICSMVSSGYSTGKLIWLLIGVMLLLGQQDIISGKMMWGIILAAVIIIIGLSIIFGGVLRDHGIKKYTIAAGGAGSSETALFSGRKISFANQVFEGIKVSAIFGGIELDLRQAVIEHDVVVDASAVFGGVDIFLPQTVKVVISADSVFGGIDNKYDNTGKDDCPALVLRGSCVFGGIELK